MSTYVVIIFLLWLTVLSYLVYTTRRHYHKLVAKTKKGTIGEILETLMSKDEVFDKQVDKLAKEIRQLTDREKRHYQKSGLVRFNPFERVGGQQSFILTLLDNQDSGLIINFLHTREGIRVYAKKIKQGVSEEYQLSGEEKEAIKTAG